MFEEGGGPLRCSPVEQRETSLPRHCRRRNITVDRASALGFFVIESPKNLRDVNGHVSKDW